jgi:hypothetical protein
MTDISPTTTSQVVPASGKDALAVIRAEPATQAVGAKIDSILHFHPLA